MQSIPPEFAPFNYYLEAAQQFQSRYPDISDVLNKCFSDSCQDLVDQGSASPEAQDFLAQFNDSHTNPPEEAIQQTKQVADKFFTILKKQYDSGRYTPTLEKQLGLTSILYSVLEGEDTNCEQCKEMRKNVQNMLIGGIAGPISSPSTSGANASTGGPPAYTPPAPAAPSPSPTNLNSPGSSQGPPVFTPPAASPTIPNSPALGAGSPVYPVIPNAGSNDGPPVFTPPAASPTIPNSSALGGGSPVYPTIPNASGSSGGPPAFTPSGYDNSHLSQAPSFTPTSSTYANIDPPSVSQPSNNTAQQQQLYPSSAADSPPPYGSFPPTASVQLNQQQQQTFNASEAASFLNSLGYTIISSSIYPPLNNSTYPVIQTYIDYAISSLKNNDSAQCLAFLQNAFKVWTTGSQ